ncbi:MAG: hypothetical protein HY869_17975 [Chloroflexi bacterium]|nr:hypothetical protein [Chloroflexota bacterium]
MTKLLTLIPFALWAAAWMLGGQFIAHQVFRLRRERLIVGLALGFVLQLWLSNLMSHLMPVPYSFWVGAALVLVFGLAVAWKSLLRDWHSLLTFSLPQALVLLFLFYVFFSIGRGLNIFDDFQNIPLTSIMAAGDIPPHFPFDPSLRFGYHYLLLIFSAQLTRLGDLFPWTAMDAARALALSLLVMLAYLWTRRMTRSRIAGCLGAFFVAFSGGARWLLLLLPAALTQKISEHISLLGSGIPTAPDLAQALISPWAIEGGGPFPFPFAFANGVNSPAAMTLGGIGVMGPLILLLLIMLFRRLRGLTGGIVLAAILAAYALTGEYTFLIVYPSVGLLLLIEWIRARRIHLPRSFLPTLGVGSVALVFALVQGGVLTEIARGMLFPAADAGSFHTFNFAPGVPAFVSAHLGFMSLLDPYQLIAGLFEMGPVLLALPLLFIWGRKMFRAQQWWEAGVAVSAGAGLFSLFVKYTGTAGVSATTRLMVTLVLVPTLYAVPLVWIWLRKRSESLKLTGLSLGLISIFGGLVFLGVQLIAIQNPILPYFMNEMDVRMENRHWNLLPRDAMVFDADPRRAVTVFGRGSNSMSAWVLTPEWNQLMGNPEPQLLNAAGFDYIYFGTEYWEEISPEVQYLYQDACVKLVDEVQGTRAPDDYRKDFRRLLDISACQ